MIFCVPFSVLMGFVAGRLTPRVRERIDAPLLLAGSAVVAGGGFVIFAAARSNLAELFVAMGVLGVGVGSFSAAMPGVILAVTPKSETSSAMSFNYVLPRTETSRRYRRRRLALPDCRAVDPRLAG